MGKIIFELLTPILLIMYLIVEIIVPSFTNKEYFWWTKSFKKKPKGTFEEEVRNAEKVYEDAKTTMERLKDSAGEEAKEAEKRLTQAKEALDKTKQKIENLNK